jgi:hypothetical protein
MQLRMESPISFWGAKEERGEAHDTKNMDTPIPPKLAKAGICVGN